MIKRFSKSVSLMAVFIIPLNTPQGWQLITYKKIQPNTVSWSPQGLVINVKSSASPIVYPFGSTKKISKISFKGKIKGGLKFPDGAFQGEKGFDDFEMRLGLVIPGNNRLSWLERKLAPDWVLELQSLAPVEAGIEKVVFLNLSSHKISWKQRQHPLSKYFEEKIVGVMSSEFQGEHTFEKPLEVVALWISVDGDDLKQNYEVTLTDIQFEEI